MKRKMDLKLFLCAIITHVIIFYSIFDIYFQSPLIHGMQPIEQLNTNDPPAKRLVLYVADGLREDTFKRLVDSNRSKYLKSRIEIGASGTSFTRVPTESRPGHVAIIAGFYEDISAVAKGWKENPIEFDSVFNRSKYCFSWGSPDIMQMFTKYSSKIYANSYNPDDEDFAAKDASLLDTWVIDRFMEFLDNAESNRTLFDMIHNEKVVFFFHFLGIDTNGHSKKPHSKEYIDNVILVDKIIQNITERIEKFYSNDKKTSFIFTADHGMTDWGSHGSGDDSERLTPFVSWGYGIKNVVNLSIEQADIAPLMSNLIGVSIPLNSIGKLPLSLLDLNDESKALSYKTNALQILEQLKIKQSECKKSAILFQEFKEFKMSDAYKLLNVIDQDILDKKFEQAISKLDKLIDQSLSALDYYNRYHRFYLGTCISLAFIGWIFYLITYNLQTESENLTRKEEKFVDILFSLLFLFTVLLSIYQNFPITYYFYVILPIFLWRSVLLKYKYWIKFYNSCGEAFLANAFKLFLLIIGVELIVLSFFYRLILTLLLIFNGFVLLFLLHKRAKSSFKWLLIVSPFMLSIFPALPVISGETNIKLVYISSIALNISFIFIFKKNEKLFINKKYGSFIILGINLFTLFNIYWVRSSIEQRQSIPKLCQFYSYLNIAFWFILPMCNLYVNTKTRLISLIFCLCNLYLHLSISYESLFILCITLQMISWLFVECFFYCGEFSIHAALVKKGADNFLHQETHETFDFEWSMVVRVYLLLFHILVAFFGTGNMASINSFDVVSVYCYTTIFNPFLMGFLLLIKVIVPFMLVISIFYCIHDIINLSISDSLVLIMVISDIMALNFFFLIKTNGSWLDIGMSISHYIISMILVIVILLLFYLIRFLFTFNNGDKTIKKSK